MRINRKCTDCKYENHPLGATPCRNCKGDVNYFELIEDKDKEDMVNKPPHYTQGAIECIDVIEEITKPCSKFEAYIIGTVLKYLWRFKFKNGLEDLKKARWYLDKLIGKMEVEE